MSSAWVLASILIGVVVLFLVAATVPMLLDQRQQRRLARLDFDGSPVSFRLASDWPNGVYELIFIPLMLLFFITNEELWQRFKILTASHVAVFVFLFGNCVWKVLRYHLCPSFEGTNEALIKRDRFGSEDVYAWSELQAVTLEPPIRRILWGAVRNPALSWYRITLDFGRRGRLVLPPRLRGLRFLEMRLAMEAEERGVPIRGRERADETLREIHLD
ncbi:MAG: hypothetical protein AAFR84_06150 [Pseudomonadota bacterium]